MRSWTDPGADRQQSTWADAARDLGHLLRFRAATVRRRWVGGLGAAVLLGLTVLFVVGPARSGEPGDGPAGELLAQLTATLDGNLGPALVTFFVLTIGASMSGGGGRELLSRTEATIHPISPRTEHLGSLLLSPLNLAWLVQAWGLLAAVSLVMPTDRLPGALVVVVLWFFAATTTAQAIGWVIEGVRRLRHGVVAVRALTVVIGVSIGVLHLSGRLLDVVHALPTTALVEAMRTGSWPVAALVLAVLGVVFLLLGALPAAWALGLPPREELRSDSGVFEARSVPQAGWLDADLALLRRLDRGSVWRSMGMRRGLIVLGLGPGLVALVAGLTWSSVLMLPGLAASGAALLFGVNAWCLDGKGMVWRSTLPVEASKVFDARALVVTECLVVVSAITLAMALVRNGLPPVPVTVCVLLCWLVVVMQVLGASMWWSVRSPYSVDLSSPRATPAPHAVMASYAGRLSLVTTLTGLLFVACAALAIWWIAFPIAAAFLLKSGLRLRKARRRWLQAPERARVTLTVAAV